LFVILFHIFSREILFALVFLFFQWGQDLHNVGRISNGIKKSEIETMIGS